MQYLYLVNIMNSSEKLSNMLLLNCNMRNNDEFVRKNGNVNKILRYMPRVINQGIPEHFFITGDKGVGKTSFIRNVAGIARNIFDMLPVYVSIKGVNTVDDMIEKVFEGIFREFNKTDWGKRFTDSFFSQFEYNYCPDINFLVEICENLKDFRGIFIIIDDIDGLCEYSNFPTWYKATFETLYIYNEFIPIAFSLVGNHEVYNRFYDLNPSFPRMFNYIEINDCFPTEKGI